MTGLERDAAYEYINWYLDGWVGGFLMRQGYYSAVPETSKNFMTENEWGYWFARRRFFLRPHGRGRLLERGDGRKPVHGPQMERVHRRMTLCVAAPGRGAVCPPDPPRIFDEQ